MGNLVNSILLSTMTVVMSTNPLPAQNFYRGPCEEGEICTTVELKIPQQWIVMIEDQVPDFQEWVYRAIEGKVNKSEEKILKKEIDRCLNEGTPIPDTRYTIINQALNRDDYKNRKERDAEAKIKLNRSKSGIKQRP